MINHDNLTSIDETDFIKGENRSHSVDDMGGKRTRDVREINQSLHNK